MPWARASVLKRGPRLRLPTGLFEKHKLLFSFNMTIKIEQADGRVPQEELDFFLKGNGLAGFHSPPVHRHLGHACPVAKSPSGLASRSYRSSGTRCLRNTSYLTQGTFAWSCVETGGLAKVPSWAHR